MSYIDKIRKKTKDFLPLRVKEEIDKVKTGIENAASNGEYEYHKLKSSFKYLNAIIEYFKKEDFHVKVEEKLFEEDPYMRFKDDYLIINWEEQSNNDGSKRRI